MDKYLEFTTRVEAQSCLDAINLMAANYWSSQGFTVVGTSLVGKKQGVDNPSAARTTTWDEVRKIKVKFYIASLTGTAFEIGMEQLQEFNFVEVSALPSEVKGSGDGI